ncbi:MAG: hypothetical protein ACSHYB_14685 [Roseibacillus sp.]
MAEKIGLLLSVGLLLGLCVGCKDSGDSRLEEVAAVEIKYPNSEEGLKKLAKDLNHNGELLRELLPTNEECALIGAGPVDAELIEAYVETLKEELPAEGIGGNDSQTEVLVGSGTTDAMKAGTEMEMAGGYSQEAEHFGPALTLWKVSYVEPGEDSGMRFDAFIHLNGRWVLVPKVWRAFR